MTRPPRPRWILPLLLFLTVLAAAFLFMDMRARRADADMAPVLETADTVTSGLRTIREELNSDLAAIYAHKPGAYSVFRNNHVQRMQRMAALEGRAESLQPAAPQAEALRALLIRYVGLQISMELTLRSCYESFLFSQGAAMENSCYTTAMELLAQDLAKHGQDIAALRAKLQRKSWLQKALATTPGAKPDKPADPQRPGIIVILLDAARADALGAYGAQTGATPFLDQIARQGVVFENIQAPSAVTHISVASLLSGADPYEANAEAFSQWNSGLSLVKNFKDAGFFTAGFSANSIISNENRFETGFDYFRDRYWPPAAVMVNEVRSHIAAHGLPRPFFLYLHLIDPHDPYFSPDSVPDLARNARPQGLIPDPNKIRADYEEKGLDARTLLPPGNLDYLKSLYTQEIRYTDRWLQHLFSILDNSGALKNTLVIIIADHGEQFLEHGGVKHTRMLYQELVHVPLIMWGALPPGLQAGTRVPEPHSLMELLPSLLAWQGAPPKGTAGRRTTLFSGKEPSEPMVSVTWGYRFGDPAMDAELVALRRGNMKFILDAAHGEFRLFDLAADPGEQNDLSAALPEQAAAFRDQAMALRRDSRAAAKRHGAPAGQSDSLKKQLKSLGYTH